MRTPELPAFLTLLLATTIAAGLSNTSLAQQTKQQKATLTVAGIFGDGMVLQHQSAAAIWGQAKSGSKIEIKTSWDGKTTATTAGADGKWKTTIDTPAAGGPHTIEVASGSQRKKFKNVLSGEVWICSGQSNMQWKMRGFGLKHWAKEISEANHPEIRLCQVPQALALKPQDNIKTAWKQCSPKEVTSFSAVAYFFGDILHRELDVPIGLISTNWGGSSAEAWVNPEVLKSEFPEFNPVFGKYDGLIEKHGATHANNRNKPKGLNQRMPAVLHNKMIRPLVPFTCRGVIWYQGESNVKTPIQYRNLFPTLIESWRKEWGQEKLPFYYVQIAPFHYQRELLPVALLREAQFQTLSVPDTGMAVTMDIGDPTNIHPKRKKPVAERLAKLALAETYGRTDLVYSGPEFVGHEIQQKQIRLRFKHVGGGLASRDGKPLSHFTMAGKDRIFHPASAEIDGETLLVSSPKVTRPESVRFAWGNADEPNLMNKEGLPSSSFRTDNWEIKPRTPPKPKRKQPQKKGQKKPSNEKLNSGVSSPNKLSVAAKNESADDTKAELPNIVFIMPDELAYYELSHMGNTKIHTPNIDQMAREGIRFTRALAAAPVCGPLRCCLMTGKHMGHASMRDNRGGTPIRADEPTIASMLKARGYATGGFGKWGIGGRGSEGVPETHGFDEFFGYYDQVHAHSFYTAHLIRNSQEVPLPGNKGGRNGETYSHYEIMKEGLNFIRENKDRPFFCYLPITPPHGKFDIPADDPAFDLYKDDAWMQNPDVSQDTKNYAAMVSMIDDDLKNVLDLLKELSLDKKTIVFFTGDNGGENRFADKQHPGGFFGPNVNPKTGVRFRGKKRELYEGGLRIPFLVRWPEKIDAGKVSDHLFYQVDMMATLAELTGSELPVKTDGLSILPTLVGEDTAGHPQSKHEFMYWEYLKQVAVRKGTWKAIKPNPKSDWQLYDLKNDISESNDVAAQHQELVAEMARFATQSRIPARPGKFIRTDLQKRDRIARNAVPEPLEKPK